MRIGVKVMHKWVSIGVLVLILGMLAGVGVAQEATPAPTPHPALKDRRLTIGWIPKALDNPVFELGRDACFQAADELTARGDVRVECIYSGPVTADPVDQALVIADLVAQGVDALAVSCVDAAECAKAIDAAIAAGVPVMTWDSDAPDSQRLTYLGVDNYAAGTAAGELLVQSMGESGRVIVLSGVEDAPNLQARVNGFADYVAQFPQIEIVEVLYCNDDPVLGAQLLEEAISTDGDLDGIFMAGIWPLLAGREALPQFVESAADMHVIGFDTLPVQLEWMQDGLIDALVGQKYWGWGYDAMYIMFDHVVNGQPYPFIMDSGFDIVTPENLDVMIGAWNSRDFSQPIPLPSELRP